MDRILNLIEETTDISRKYQLVIEYFEENGAVFRKASPDHIKNRYRILENGSSIFVYDSLYRMKITDADKKKLEAISWIEFETCYRNKELQIVENARPWTFVFKTTLELEEVVNCLNGFRAEEININIAVKPKEYDVFNNVICPVCEYHFIKADRCPNCGQKIFYDEKPYNTIDYAIMLSEINECQTKRDLHEVMHKYGFRSFGKATDTANSGDLYYQFVDGDRIHFQKDQLSLYTNPSKMALYFSRYESKFKECSDGSYRTRKAAKIPKTKEELEFLISHFYNDKRNRLT